MTDDEIKAYVIEMITSHTHNQLDSQRVNGKDLFKAPQAALTTASGGALTTGGAAVLSAADSAILSNAIARIAQLELRLKNLGLLPN